MVKSPFPALKGWATKFRIIFTALLIPICTYSAFEDLSPLECKTLVLPSTPKIELTYVQPFGMLHYAKFSCLWKGLMFGCSTFGGEVYRENELLFGYCGKRGLSQKDFYYGISAKVMNLVIKNYRNSWTIGLSGEIMIPIEQTLISIALINFNNPSIGEEEISLRILGGITIFPVDNFRLGIGLYKEEGYPVEIMVNNRITLSQYFELGFGIKTIPTCYSAGVIFHIKNIDFLYSVRTHETLDLTHIISLGYSLNP